MAILAAVLVPTITSKINDANESSAKSSCSALAESIRADVISALAASDGKCEGQHGTITIANGAFTLENMDSGDSKITIAADGTDKIKISHDTYEDKWYYTVDTTGKVTMGPTA